MSDGSSNKRQRLTIHGDATTTTSTWTGVQRRQTPWDMLPSEVAYRIVALCDTPARLALCQTCKASRDAVEHHEKLVYEAILSSHRVDEDFEFRVCKSSQLKTTITKRKMPVPRQQIPYRYRKIAALNTYLYKINIPKVDAHTGGISELMLSPQEESLLAITDSNEFYLSKLSSREHCCKFDLVGLQMQWLDESNILAYSEHNCLSSHMSIWSEDPEKGIWKRKDLTRQLDDEQLLPYDGGDWVYDGQDVYAVMLSEGLQELILLSINLVNISMNTMILTHQENYSDLCFPKMVGLSSNRWLLFTCVARHGNGALWMDFAYNLDTKRSAKFLAGTGDSMIDLEDLQKATDCSTTFCALRKSSQTIVVFELGDDGRFSEKISFALPSYARGSSRIVRASRSYVFVWINRTWIEMYDTKSGDCCRSLHTDNFCYSVSVSSIRNEVFVGEEYAEDGVRAFCLKEPLVV